MSVGTYFSVTGHAALVVWMVVGWGMSAEPLPFEVTEVSVVTGEEFAALTQGVQPDAPAGAVPELETPQIEDPAPVVPTPEVEAPPTPAQQPDVIAPPAAETPPEAPDLTVPDTVVTDTPPDVPDTPTIIAPPPSAEVGTSVRPVPRPAPRVAPEIVAPPNPDATVAPEVTEAATDQVEAPDPEPVEPADETTAPEAAADQIVTEAEEPAFAPEISSRPQTRPSRPAPAVDAPADDVDPVAAAVAEAASQATEPTPPTPATEPTPGLGGGELSEGDKAGFLRQIGNCWNTGTLSTGAQNTIIVMAFAMTPEGRPVTDSISLDSFTGGSAADAEAAFQTARRALIRCTDEGYDLPRDQYSLWQRVELTVDPTAMRQR
ncbi:cell envelope biogenesis protein TolA [Pseudooctadecabacter jejudonensis]|uniref:Uncharacterized protein n=1 Tax=Pseudooctadecabacter jejudonensis TaxID=1391910 RepID=A0A1Y5SZ35_9RHOB|nr:cell envelope biogenesis protein TolA [Pseudooctadecabacter jejudonensis]SLN49886.1 hypothetical protein PSJ8397_02593 [Pseudooctadecabacter jejudonensis]